MKVQEDLVWYKNTGRYYVGLQEFLQIGYYVLLGKVPSKTSLFQFFKKNPSYMSLY